MPANGSYLVHAVMPLWLVGTLAALWNVEAYKAAPGGTGATPQQCRAVIASNQPRLLLFLHPHCPCSAASLSEFGEILSTISSEVDAEVLFVLPEDVAPGWEQSQLWTAASQVPGARVNTDEGGTLARKYGARTSGHVVLYDARGHLLFSGGITRSRGHQGDNTGRRAVIAALRGLPREQQTTQVFGCPLLSPAECQACGDVLRSSETDCAP